MQRTGIARAGLPQVRLRLGVLLPRRLLLQNVQQPLLLLQPPAQLVQLLRAPRELVRVAGLLRQERLELELPCCAFVGEF